MRTKRAFEKLSYLSIIPGSASVMANFNLVPHLSNRKYVFDFYPIDKFAFMVDYLVIDLTMLDYLSSDAKKQVPDFISEASRRGYNRIFSNSDKTFIILYNPKIDKTLIEKQPRE